MIPESTSTVESLAGALAHAVLQGKTAGYWASPEVLTLAEMAGLLRVPEEAVRQLVASGEIPGRLIAGEWRVLKGTVTSWLGGTDYRRGVKVGGGWVEDGGFSEGEKGGRRTRPSPSGSEWGDEASREAEQFIEQIRESRRSMPAEPADQDAGS